VPIGHPDDPQGNMSIKYWNYDNIPEDVFPPGDIQRKLSFVAQYKIPYTTREALYAAEEGKKVIIFSKYSERVIPYIIKILRSQGWINPFGQYPVFNEHGDPVYKPTKGTETPKIKWETVQHTEEELDDPNRPQFVVLTGGTAKGLTADTVEAFTEDPKVKIFVGNIAAAGTGLNLQAGTYTVYNDMDWIPSTHEQSEDRTRRIGQDYCTSVIYMIADCWIDREMLLPYLQQKRDNIAKLQEGQNDPDAFRGSFLDTYWDSLGGTEADKKRRKKKWAKENDAFEKKQKKDREEEEKNVVGSDDDDGGKKKKKRRRRKKKKAK